MKISCIALDLDRTTLGSNGRLSAENRNAIEAAIEQGIHVVIASGRALTSLPRDVLAIKGIQYAITSNGAAVYDLHTGECLKQYKLTAESAEHILKLTRGREVAYEAFIDGQPYAQKEYVADPVRFGALPGAIPYIQSTRRPVEDMQLFFAEHIKELDCLDLVVKNEEIKCEIREELERKVSDIYVTSSVEQLLEISYKECGKHSGIKVILEHLGLERQGLAAFGDADNDADLLSFAGLGIAMANASQKCREAADWTTRSNDEDGVAYGIRQRILPESALHADFLRYGEKE